MRDFSSAVMIHEERRGEERRGEERRGKEKMKGKDERKERGDGLKRKRDYWNEAIEWIDEN